MPVAHPHEQPQPHSAPTPAGFPAATKQAAGTVNGEPTDVMVITFSDKILVTITQQGMLAQWVHVALDPSLSGRLSESHIQPDDDNGLLPRASLTPTSILGGTTPEREIIGQLLATQIASAILTKNPAEDRMLVLGLGLPKVDKNRETFFSIIDLVLECL